MKPHSFLLVEKALLGECDAGELAGLEAEMSSNPELRAYYEEAKGRKSALTWEKLQARLAADPAASATAATAPARKHVPSAGPGFFGSLRDRFEAWFPRPQAAFAWAGGLAMLVLVVPLTWMQMQDGNGLRVKGNLRPEVALEVDGARVAPDGHAHAKAGSILTFSYKSKAPLSAQIWYVEDAGAPSRFDGKDDPSLAWSASPEWSRAPQRIELDGAWKTQRVVVVVSAKALAAGEASGWISGAGKPRDGTAIFTFHLEQP